MAPLCHRRTMTTSVLVVDDDPAFRQVAAEVLRDRGYTIAGEAASLKDARKAIGTLQPDAILLDVNLPDGNGIALAAELVGAPGPVRVLLTSSDERLSAETVTQGDGAVGFVSKTEIANADLDRYLKD
jgi:CheY-like chemotaxis protein